MNINIYNNGSWASADSLNLQLLNSFQKSDGVSTSGSLSLGYSAASLKSNEFTLSGGISAGISATVGGQIVPTFPGLYVGGGSSLGLTSHGQVFAQFQANGMTGVGYYAGVGAIGNFGAGGLLPTGLSIDSGLHVEGNAGWGQSAGYSIDTNMKSISLGKSLNLKAGPGFGVMQAAGPYQSVTIAFPPLW